jgi:molecular chaperone GrpE
MSDTNKSKKDAEKGVETNFPQNQEVKLKLEIETLKKELEDYKSKYLRALADYQNLEKRVTQEKEEVRKYANSLLILDLLPFLDHLDKAEIFIQDPGLKMIKNNFFSLLKRWGLEEIEILNKDFDPLLAEAVELVEGKKDNVVAEVVRKGYLYQGKVLRIAQVKVSKKTIKN